LISIEVFIAQLHRGREVAKLIRLSNVASDARFLSRKKQRSGRACGARESTTRTGGELVRLETMLRQIDRAFKLQRETPSHDETVVGCRQSCLEPRPQHTAWRSG